MKLTVLHPDPLLEHDERQTLSAEQRRELDAHLTSCASCRLEVQLRRDFDAWMHGKAEEDGRARQLVDRVLAEMDGRENRQASARRWWVRGLWLGAAVLATGAAAAGVWKSGRFFSEANREAAPVPSSAVPPADRTHGPAASATSEATPVVSVEDLAVVEDAPAPSAAPQPSASAGLSASELYLRATQAHRAGQTQAAIRLFEELQRRYPESREAKASHATLGRLLLDSEAPSAALEHFDTYLDQRDGVVSQEALVGRAEALRKLGRAAEERAVWEELLRRHPNSVHATRARQRLGELR